MSLGRRAIVTALVVAIAAGVVSSALADPSFERRRGGIPPADDEIVATLLRFGAPATDALVSIGGSERFNCVNEKRGDGRRLETRLATHFGWYYDGDVFYLGAVELGPRLVGFLLRVPGLLTSSVIDLWTYDIGARRWLAPVELVDNWGDPDQWYFARAWLVDLDGDGYRDIVKREKIGAGGRLTEDRVTIRRGGPDGFGAPRAEPSSEARFDFVLACR